MRGDHFIELIIDPEEPKAGILKMQNSRGPAHQLRLMEDSMLVYRLSRAPERRVFYIDVGQLPPFKACRNLGRNFIGFEIDEEYYKICCERLK